MRKSRAHLLALAMLAPFFFIWLVIVTAMGGDYFGPVGAGAAAGLAIVLLVSMDMGVWHDGQSP